MRKLLADSFSRDTPTSTATLRNASPTVDVLSTPKLNLFFPFNGRVGNNGAQKSQRCTRWASALYPSIRLKRATPCA